MVVVVDFLFFLVFFLWVFRCIDGGGWGYSLSVASARILCFELVVEHPVGQGGLLLDQTPEGVVVTHQSALASQLLLHEVGRQPVGGLRVHSIINRELVGLLLLFNGGRFWGRGGGRGVGGLLAGNFAMELRFRRLSLIQVGLINWD